MKIDWEGRVYDLDTLGALLSQAAQITAYTGCESMSEWERVTVSPEDKRFPQAVTAMYWLMLVQDGQDPDLAALDIPFLRFFLAIGEAAKAEAAAAGAEPEDPTKPAAGSGGTSPGTATDSAG